MIILPAQAAKIAEVTAEHGSAVGVTQLGSVLTLNLGYGRHLAIDAKGEEIPPQTERLC